MLITFFYEITLKKRVLMQLNAFLLTTLFSSRLLSQFVKELLPGTGLTAVKLSLKITAPDTALSLILLFVTFTLISMEERR